MIDGFIKVYFWTASMPADIRLVYSVIHQMTENGTGFWGGYRLMAEWTGVAKSRCKTITEFLVAEGAVVKSTEPLYGKTRLILRTKGRYFYNKPSRALASV